MNRFIWLTGFPAVGKTTLLKNYGCKILYVDEVRDDLLSNNRDELSKLESLLQVELVRWPLNKEQFNYLHSSYQQYIDYSKCLALLLKSKVDNLLHSNTVDFVEISPFLLSFWHVKEPIIFKMLPDNLHTKNLASRLGLNDKDAESYLDFYNAAYFHLPNRLRIDAILSSGREELENILQSL